MTLGAAMAGGNPDPARGRDPDDWYPTPPDVTKALARELHPMLWGNVWEPCAGDGMMVDALETSLTPHCNVWPTDIKPRRSDIEQLDFFQATEMYKGTTSIITNPPYDDFPERFIRHAFSIGVQRMALLLKSTYWHAKSRLPLFKEFQPMAILPLTWRPDFKNLGRPTMEVAWNVWDRSYKGEYPIYQPLSK